MNLLSGNSNTPMLSRGGSSTGSNTPSGLRDEGDGEREREREQEAVTPVVSIAKEKILEMVLKKEKDSKPVLSLVVVGSFLSFFILLSFNPY